MNARNSIKLGSEGQLWERFMTPQWRNQATGPAPPLFLDQNEARRAFPYLRVWITAPLPPT